MHTTQWIRSGRMCLLGIILVMGISWPALAAGIKDSESATHDSDASQHRIVDHYRFNGFEVIQFELPVLSVYSYLLISDGQALMIDPVRDIRFYLETARQNGATISGIWLSHSHADFIAGHMEMVKAVGCPIYQSHLSGVAYAAESLREGSSLTLGGLTVKFIETPGHTPDGMCALVFGPGQPQSPQVMFTGDVLFVGSVGRPDLLEGTVTAAWLAGAAFDSWTGKIAGLGDDVRFFPAHGAGSLCGAHLSDEPNSTIGREKAANPYFKHTRRSDFIAALLEGLPEAPQYFKHNARINRQGPDLAAWDAPLPAEIPANQDLSDPERYYVVDLRDAKAYAAGHIPKAVNIAVRGRLETWVGIMVPWEAQLVVCGSSEELREARRRLLRVGYQPQFIDYRSWQAAAHPLTVSPGIKPAELFARKQNGSAPVVVDVRLPNEWMALRIGTVLNLPLNRLDQLSRQLDPNEPVVTVCNSAYRSSLAVGVLERRGFTRAMSLDGGSEAWIQAGLPVLEPTAPGQMAGAAAALKKFVRLPEFIAPESLKRLLMDLPGTFDLIDIRPPAHFQDYHLPGARNMEPAELLANAALLVGPSPLIIVDRDGYLAAALAGALVQKTERSIKVLYSGLAGYWSQTTGVTAPPAATPAAPVPPVVSPESAPAAVKPAAPATPAQPSVAPKRKSAGC